MVISTQNTYQSLRDSRNIFEICFTSHRLNLSLQTFLNSSQWETHSATHDLRKWAECLNSYIFFQSLCYPSLLENRAVHRSSEEIVKEKFMWLLWNYRPTTNTVAGCRCSCCEQMQMQLGLFPVECKTRFLLHLHLIKSQVLAKNPKVFLSVRYSPRLDIVHESSQNHQPPTQNCVLSGVHGDMWQGINWKAIVLLLVY